MTTFLEVQEAPASITEVQKFDPKAWPGLGLFTLRGDLFCVGQSSVMWLGSASHYTFVLDPVAGTLDAHSQVTANDLLKAIAISQQPQLARELLK